jgi:hypothetical protein
MLCHVIHQQLFLLEDLMTFSAGVNNAVEVDEAVNSKFLLHFETKRTLGAFEVLRVRLLIGMDCFLM